MKVECHAPTASRRSDRFESFLDVKVGRSGRGGRRRSFSGWGVDGLVLGLGRCRRRDLRCSSKTSCRMSSGSAARKSSDISDLSGDGEGCLDGWLAVVDGLSRARPKPVWVSFILPDGFEGGRPRRFFVGIVVLGALEGAGGCRAATEEVEGCSVGCGGL